MEEDILWANIGNHNHTDYFALSDGRVFRIREIRPHTNKTGYQTIAMFDSNGKVHPSTTLHSVIAGAFIGPRPPGMTINHIDGNKQNNRADNLEYMTSADNIRHSHRIGLHDLEKRKAMLQKLHRDNIGRRNATRKLTDEQAIEIIRLYKTGEFSMKSLGQQFGVTAPTICLLVNGKRTYKFIPRDGEKTDAQVKHSRK